MTAVDQVNTLSTLVQMRSRTDVAIRTNWLVFPLASYSLWAFLAVVYLTGTLRTISNQHPGLLVGTIGILGFAASAGPSYLLYSLINRRNKHSAREQALLWEALNKTRSKAGERDMKALIPLSSAERDFASFHQGTHERSAVLWALLTLIPYAGWIFLIIALYRLSEDFKVHQQREGVFLEDLDRSLQASGAQGLGVRSGPVSSGNAPAFALLSIVTLGALSLYWLFVMVRDPQVHFGYHTLFEDSLSKSLAESDPESSRMI